MRSLCIVCLLCRMRLANAFADDADTVHNTLHFTRYNSTLCYAYGSAQFMSEHPDHRFDRHNIGICEPPGPRTRTYLDTKTCGGYPSSCTRNLTAASLRKQFQRCKKDWWCFGVGHYMSHTNHTKRKWLCRYNNAHDISMMYHVNTTQATCWKKTQQP